MPYIRADSSSIPDLNFFLLCSVDMMTQHWSLCCVAEILRSSPTLCSALCCTDFSYWDCGDDKDLCSYSSTFPCPLSCVAKPNDRGAVSTSTSSTLLTSLTSSLSTDGNVEYSSARVSGSGNKADGLIIVSKANRKYNDGDNNHGYSDSSAVNSTNSQQSPNALNLIVKSKHQKTCVSTIFSRCADTQHQLSFQVKSEISQDIDSKTVTVGKENNLKEQTRPRVMSNIFQVPENALINLSSSKYSAFLSDIKIMYIDIGKRLQRVSSYFCYHTYSVEIFSSSFMIPHLSCHITFHVYQVLIFVLLCSHKGLSRNHQYLNHPSLMNVYSLQIYNSSIFP